MSHPTEAKETYTVAANSPPLSEMDKSELRVTTDVGQKSEIGQSDLYLDPKKEAKMMRKFDVSR